MATIRLFFPLQALVVSGGVGGLVCRERQAHAPNIPADYLLMPGLLNMLEPYRGLQSLR